MTADERHTGDEWMDGRRRLIARALREAQLTGTGTIVDVAAGDGSLSAIVASHTGGRLLTHDMDLSECQRSRDAGREVARGDVLELPVRDAIADLTVAFEIIEHFPEWQGARLVAELARITRPGGVLLLSTPNRYSLESWKGLFAYLRRGIIWNAKDQTHVQICSTRSLRRALRDSFDIDVMYGYFFTPEVARRPMPWTYSITRHHLLVPLCHKLFVVARRRSD